MAFESEKSFPFDSEIVSGEYDREYKADDFARYFRAFISSGMFLDKKDNLQIVANGDMTVTLKPGAIIIDGYRYDNVQDIIIPLSPADGVLNRIDRISLTWDKNERDIHVVKREGIPAYDAIAPECRRTAEYLDYVTADIFIAAGSISVSQADITDQRLNSVICGIAVPFGRLDTSALYAQIQSDLSNFRNVSQEEFNIWFEIMRNKLSEDAAGSLQSQIGMLEGLLTSDKDNLVNAINELAQKEVDVLDTVEEIEANTSPGIAAGALALKATKNIFGGISQFFVDPSSGEITGYTTEIGGADTVFPFKKVKIQKGSIRPQPSGTSDYTKITTGFKPKVVFVTNYADNNSDNLEYTRLDCYMDNSNMYLGKGSCGFRRGLSNTRLAFETGTIVVEDDGFRVYGVGSSYTTYGTLKYLAIDSYII